MTSTIDMAGLGRVAVLMGGLGAERDVSLVTGNAVADSLARSGVDVTRIDWQDDLVGPLLAGAFDRVFIALHGRGGEDGQVQGLLETLGIDYTGSGVLGSALAMDKVRSKRIWQSCGLPTANFVPLARGFDPEAVVQALGLPIMVKPAREGSSFGASVVRQGTDLVEAFENAARYDAEVMAEQFIDGDEFTCSILTGEALPLIRLQTRRVFYDYTAKYVDDDTRYLCPCGLPAGRERELQALALAAFDALGASGWGRVDFMLTAAGEPRLLEANTVPGMTSHSLVPMAAAAVGIDFDKLCLRILAAARRHGPVPVEART